jgi:quercetin dioxygenase-like cupin family protein
MRRTAFTIAVACLTCAMAQRRDTGVTAVSVENNATANIYRLHMPPGTAHILSATAPAHVVVQITPGDVQIDQVGENSRGPLEAGAVSYVAAGQGHHAVNIGTTAFDRLGIAIKPTRPPAESAPATEAPPGITRITLIDNDDVRVVRVTFAPTGREPVHTHPNDLVTVQISEGQVEIVNGAGESTSTREPGFVQFLPRNVMHAFASADPKPFEILSVSIK